MVDNHPMSDLTAFQRDILVMLEELDEPNGLRIKDNLQLYYDEQIRHGRLYPNLDTLIEKGLIKKGKQNERANAYRLTQRGKRDLQAHFEWMQDHMKDDEAEEEAIPA